MKNSWSIIWQLYVHLITTLRPPWIYIPLAVGLPSSFTPFTVYQASASPRLPRIIVKNLEKYLEAKKNYRNFAAKDII